MIALAHIDLCRSDLKMLTENRLDHIRLDNAADGRKSAPFAPAQIRSVQLSRKPFLMGYLVEG